MTMIILAASIACFFTGVNFFVSNAFTAAIKHPSPNYHYLSQRTNMVTADAANVYVIDGGQLLVFGVDGSGIKSTHPLPGGFTPKFIKHAQTRVFLFGDSGFRVFSTSGGFQSQQYAYRTGSFDYFDVTYIIATNQFRVFFATQTAYCYNEYNANNIANNTAMNPPTQPTIRTFADSPARGIRAIACDGPNNLYIAKIPNTGNADRYNIHQVNVSAETDSFVNRTPLQKFTAFSVVPGGNKFVYININGDLSLFDRSLSNDINFPYIFVEPRDPDLTYKTNTSREPYFTAVVGQAVYVMDSGKLSIDRYALNGTELKLDFDKIIAAQRGGDSGFLSDPSSLTVINTGLRVNTNVATEYIVTDEAGQVVRNTVSTNGAVTSQPFLADPETRLVDSITRLSSDVRATYDNFDTIYIFDYDTVAQRNRVRTFTLDGTFKGRELTEFAGAEITRMFADTHRTVYALDASVSATRNGIWTIPSTGAPTFRTITNYKITENTNAVYNERLDSIIFTDGTPTVRTLPRTANTVEVVTLPQVDSFPQNALDAVIDTLGNVILLTKIDTAYSLTMYTPAEYTNHLWREVITGASVNESNPALCLDRMNRRILYLGTRHAVESFDLGSADVWSHTSHIFPTEWKNNKDALNPSTDAVFLTATEDVVVYAYPGGTRALALAPKGSVFKVLDKDSNYVMFEDSLLSAPYNHTVGYISGRGLSATPAPLQTPDFTDARVLFNRTIIYKYPTTITDSRFFGADENLKLLEVDKNYEQSASRGRGLQLSKLVATLGLNEEKFPVTDALGFWFYEVKLRQNSDGTYTPDVNGNHVGYVNANNVIYWNLGPSIDRFVPNATIRIPASHNLPDGIQVYEYNEVTGKFVAIVGETLANKQAVRVVGKKGPQYTEVEYNDPVLGSSQPDGKWITRGWVESQYVVQDGLSAFQVIAIIVLTLLTLAATIFVIVRIKIKRQQLG